MCSEKARGPSPLFSERAEKVSPDRRVELEGDPYAERTGIIVELFIPDHCPEVHERLPTIRQHHHEAGPKIKIVPNGNIVLEPQPGRCCTPVILGELHIDKALGIGKLMNLICINLWDDHPVAGTKGG